MSRGFLAHTRRGLLRGLLLVLPLLITLWLLGILFSLINDNVTPAVRSLLVWSGVPGLDRSLAGLGVPVIGILSTVAFIYLLGLLGGNLAGRRLVVGVESIIRKVPFVGGVYGSARQLLDAFTLGGTKTFSKVVLVEYPRQGLWTVGFVTTDVEHRLGIATTAVGAVPVFLPTTPNPTSGWMVLVPTDELWLLDLSVEDGIKLVVSGGIVCPEDLGQRVRPWTSAVLAAR